MADSVTVIEESFTGDSSSNASTIMINGESLSEAAKDQFENVLYSTTQDDKKTHLTFVSNVFFQDFLGKMKSDFASSMVSENESSISKVVTHVYGLRCEIEMNSQTRDVIASGEGHKMWRDCKFAKMTQSLFKKFVENADENGQVDTFDDESQQFLVIRDSTRIGVNTPAPQFFSTPFPARQNTMQNYGRNGQLNVNEDIVSTLVAKIDTMSQEITGLKTTLNTLMDKITPTRTFSGVVSSGTSKSSNTKKQSQTAWKQPGSPKAAQKSGDAAHGRHSGTNRPPHSVTHQRACQLSVNTPAQQTEDIPVLISDRPSTSLSSINLTLENQHDNAANHVSDPVPPPVVSSGCKKALLIGDSIIHGVNEKGKD